MSKLVIALTGPAGAGKSTVTDRIIRQRKKCAHIETDQIKQFLFSAFRKGIQPDGSILWTFEDWETLGNSTGLLAKSFVDAGYDVIINGHIREIAWKLIEKHVTLTHKFLLLPHLDTAKARDKERAYDIAMGDEAVTNAHNYFVTNSFYKDFSTLDTTDHSIDETVASIQDSLGATPRR